MRTVPGTDDYASMAETLARRAAEYEKGTNSQFKIKPDPPLIDGGRGQVAAVCAALAGTQLAGVPVFGMVKDAKHRTRGLVDSAGREITLALHRGPFTFITSIQDETHRWANDYRRRLQKGRAYSSTLGGRARRGPGHGKGPAGPLQNSGRRARGPAGRAVRGKGRFKARRRGRVERLPRFALKNSGVPVNK